MFSFKLPGFVFIKLTDNHNVPIGGRPRQIVKDGGNFPVPENNAPPWKRTPLDRPPSRRVTFFILIVFSSSSPRRNVGTFRYNRMVRDL